MPTYKFTMVLNEFAYIVLQWSLVCISNNYATQDNAGEGKIYDMRGRWSIPSKRVRKKGGLGVSALPMELQHPKVSHERLRYKNVDKTMPNITRGSEKSAENAMHKPLLSTVRRWESVTVRFTFPNPSISNGSEVNICIDLIARQSQKYRTWVGGVWKALAKFEKTHANRITHENLRTSLIQGEENVLV